jgi:hypothetical protein
LGATFVAIQEPKVAKLRLQDGTIANLREYFVSHPSYAAEVHLRLRNATRVIEQGGGTSGGDFLCELLHLF